MTKVNESPSKALRVGIVGYGEAGALHDEHLTAAGVHVIGAVTNRKVKPNRHRFTTLREMLPQVDAVTIAVPNHLHASLCLEVLRAGKPVFVEKPLLMKAEEVDALERASASADVPLHVGFRLHFNPRLRALKERLHGVRRIRCNYRLSIDDLAEGKSWTRDQALSGGAFFTMGVHAFDLVRWLAGARGEPIADLRAQSNHYAEGTNFPLVATLSGRLPSGVEVIAATDLRGNAPFCLELEVEAESGTYPDASLPGFGPEERGSEHAEYAAMMAAFAHAASHRENQPEELAEILQVHRELLEARAIAEHV